MEWINQPDKVTQKALDLINGGKLAERGTRKGRPVVWYDKGWIRRVNYTNDSGISLALREECDAQGRTTVPLIDFK